MALIVENGTGMDDAESYVSVADLDAYAAARGWVMTSYTETGKEVALRLAAQWIDTWRRYKGTRLTAAQALEFPRLGLVDWSGFEIAGVPKRVKDAAAELAYRSLSGTSLAPDQGRDAFVTKEQVGPLSVSYADNAPQSTVFAIVERLLGQFSREADPTPPTPSFGNDGTAAAFSVGMHSNPEADSDGQV